MSTEFEVDDRSFLQPWLLKYLWRPIADRLPESLRPNSISIFGLISMLSCGLFTYLGIVHSQLWFLLVTLGMGIYLTCDNIDGLFARRTKQTSTLGEFFDHWFDSFATGTISVTIGLALGLGSATRLSGYLFLAYIFAMACVHFTTFWEQLHTGVMVSGRLGSNESVITVMGVFLIITIFYGDPWLMYLDDSFSFAMGLALFTAGNAIHTILFILYRTHNRRLIDFLPLLVTLVCFVIAHVFGDLEPLWAGLGMMATNVLCSGGLLLERLTGLHYWRRFGRQAVISTLLLFHSFIYIPFLTDRLREPIFLWITLILFILSIFWDLLRALTRLAPKAQA